MTHKFQTSIWQETPMENNPFQSKQCFCYGYDVHQDLFSNASWFDYLLLLITGKKPENRASLLLEKIAMLLMNPGIRDLSVRAAMNAGVGKAPSASVLIAALSASAGQLNGAREIVLAMELWQSNINSKTFELYRQEPEEKDIWPALEHIPGFDPNSETTSLVVEVSLAKLIEISNGKYLIWLKNNLTQLEINAKHPLSINGVFAAAFCDLKLSTQQCEMLFLILRLPGAAAHAIEQQELGWKKFPFFSESVTPKNIPEAKPIPNIEELVKGYINESE